MAAEVLAACAPQPKPLALAPGRASGLALPLRGMGSQEEPPSPRCQPEAHGEGELLQLMRALAASPGVQGPRSAAAEPQLRARSGALGSAGAAGSPGSSGRLLPRRPATSCGAPGLGGLWAGGGSGSGSSGAARAARQRPFSSSDGCRHVERALSMPSRLPPALPPVLAPLRRHPSDCQPGPQQAGGGGTSARGGAVQGEESSASARAQAGSR